MDEVPASRPIGALAAAAVVAAASVGVALWAWSSPSARPTTLPVAQSHGLSVDQAACFDAGLTMRRGETRTLAVQLGKYQSLDPDAATDLQDEVSALDGLGGRHPEADDRLIQAFHEVADEGSAVLAATDARAYRQGVTRWAAESSDARRLCLEVADFDVVALDIGQSER